MSSPQPNKRLPHLNLQPAVLPRGCAHYHPQQLTLLTGTLLRKCFPNPAQYLRQIHRMATKGWLRCFDGLYPVLDLLPLHLHLGVALIIGPSVESSVQAVVVHHFLPALQSF